MNKMTKRMIAALCACFLLAGSVSAEQQTDREPAPVAGFSPNFADPQPITGQPLATLKADANRLVRWQGWLDIDAFSTSILNQMQKQVNEGVIDIDTFKLDELVVADAVNKAACGNPTFKMNKNLAEDGNGESFLGGVTLYCWLYRHNFADTGLYQLYISAKGKMLIGEAVCKVPIIVPGEPYDDIQSLEYEFGLDNPDVPKVMLKKCPIIADIEIWRGAVVRVDATGKLVIVGNEADAKTRHGVEEAPMSRWERAPSLEDNPHYNPKRATGAAFVEPLERTVRIPGNAVQVKAGSVQTERRVNTVPVYRYRAR